MKDPAIYVTYHDAQAYPEVCLGAVERFCHPDKTCAFDAVILILYAFAVLDYIQYQLAITFRNGCGRLHGMMTRGRMESRGQQ